MILYEYRTTTATEKVYNVAWSHESAFVEEIEGKTDNVLPTYSCRPSFAYFIFIFYRIPFFFEDFVSYDRTYYNVNSTCSFRPASQTAE